MDEQKKVPVYTEHGYIYELEEDAPAGEPVTEEAEAEVRYTDTEEVPSGQEEEETPAGSRKHLFLLLGVLAALLVGLGAGVAAWVHMNKAEVLNLNQYVKLLSAGFEGYGRVETQVDEEALESDIASFLLAEGSIEAAEGQSRLEAFRASAHYEDIMDSLHFTLDRDSGLSNGDQVTLTITYEPEDPDGYGLVCQAEPVLFTVSGLAQVTEMDPFGELILSVSGTAPGGMLHMEWDSDLPWTYSASRDSGLSNGDEIEIETVLKEDMDDEDLAGNYGWILTRRTMSYQVDGLPAYASDAGDLGDEAVLALQTAAMETARSQVESGYAPDESLRDIAPAGIYLLSGWKDEETPSNRIFFLFDISYSNKDTDIDYYYFVSYRDLILYPDGSWDLDQGSYEVPQSLHGLFGLIDSGDYVRIDRLHAVTGFDSVEKFYAAYIEPETGSWQVSQR